MLYTLDLFSGIGGFSLGLERTGGFKTVAFCEIEDFPRRVLNKHWPTIPIHNDIREIEPSDIGAVDVICGGYPCQPFSNAGERRGAEDDRNLWPEMRRLIDGLRPRWVIGENVAGHISMGLDDVLSDLEALDYTCRSFVVPACAVDAPHRRDRVWTIAHTEIVQRFEIVGIEPHGDNAPLVADAEGREERPGLCAHEQTGERRRRSSNGGREARAWPLESGFRRVAYGVPDRVDRLAALGNAVVPQVVERIGHAILEADK